MRVATCGKTLSSVGGFGTCGWQSSSLVVAVVVIVYLTLTDPLRIQPWSQDRRNQTKSNRKSEIRKESRQKRKDKKVASKGHPWR